MPQRMNLLHVVVVISIIRAITLYLPTIMGKTKKRPPRARFILYYGHTVPEEITVPAFTSAMPVLSTQI